VGRNQPTETHPPTPHPSEITEAEVKEDTFYGSSSKQNSFSLSSVADPGSLSLILIFTHPGSLISDPGSKTATKERGEQKMVIIPFFVATNFTKLKIIF
jgi:hypothetical protein